MPSPVVAALITSEKPIPLMVCFAMMHTPRSFPWEIATCNVPTVRVDPSGLFAFTVEMTPARPVPSTDSMIARIGWSATLKLAAIAPLVSP